jgi:alpha-1,2-mannosyltransferase
MTGVVLSPPGLRFRLQRLRVVVPIVLRSRPAGWILVGIPLAAAYLVIFAHSAGGIRTGSDFLSFWEAGAHVLHGASPYPSLDSLPAVPDRSTFEPFVYPAPAAWALVPFSVLPFALASTAWLLLSVGAIVLALRLLGVTDLRCHAAVFASVPVIAGSHLGAFSPLLLLGAAAAWRYRDQARVAAPVVAALVVAKLFLWPLWLWLVYTRRTAAATLSAVAGIVVTAVAWAAIGFAGLRDYPRLMSRLSELTGTQSYSPYALMRTLGASPGAARLLVLALVAALVVAAALAFRGRAADERGFVAAIGIALLSSPVLWPHYLVLMFVPIALLRRTFSWLWALPLLIWCDGNGWSYGEVHRIVPFIALCAVPFLLALRTERA